MIKRRKTGFCLWFILLLLLLTGCFSGKEGLRSEATQGVQRQKEGIQSEATQGVQKQDEENHSEEIQGEENHSGENQSGEIHSEEGPVFTGAEAIYSVRGEHIDYLKQIRAFDAEGNELTEEIRVDASEVIQDECGEYEVHFSVEDGGGRTAGISCRVYIVEGTEAVSLYLTEYEPAFVRISSKKDGSVVWGSGFLLDMDEKYLYLITNAHVALQPEVQVYFYEGSRAVGEVQGRKEEPDMAVVRVSREEGFPEGIVTVDASLSHWNSLDPENLPAVGYCCNREDGSSWLEKTGVLLGKEERMWALDYPVVSYTAENLPGASGSAIIDESGKLTAMALGVSEEADKTAYWGIRLPDILDFYEEVTGDRAGY
ncbi:MAG: trypsin-like peptidase domain-containing protein [Lachnospiraceae bacterium]|nr:trypsin-like peptidase domain-containing protein [Lachnospiraceae bacterium]